MHAASLRRLLNAGPDAYQASAECSKCTQLLGLLLRPRFVHDAANVLGVVKPSGCRPLDLLPSMFAAQCSDCSTLVALRGVQVGLRRRPWESGVGVGVGCRWACRGGPGRVGWGVGGVKVTGAADSGGTGIM